MHVVLEADGITIPIAVREESNFKSKHTGKVLRRRLADVTARGGKQQEWFQDVLSTSDKTPLFEHKAPTTDGPRWLLKQKSYSFTASAPGEPEYRYTVELEEYERLTPERLIADGRSLAPIKYEETFAGDVLTIRAVVQVPPNEVGGFLHFLEQCQQKRNAGDYFEVRRPGISDEPRQMRFGQIWWSEHPEGNKYAVVLVDEAYDRTTTFKWRLGREHDVAAGQTAYYANLVDSIVSKLVDRALLTAQDVADAKSEAGDQHWARVHRHYQIQDAEDE